jgi:CelD/BcsL family acetyltransferase involved in cellulose biosynthesis
MACFTTLDGVETVWRRFETVVAATPYQRFDWVRAFVAGSCNPDLRIVVVAGEEVDKPLMILPLMVERRLGLSIGSIVGGKQANYRMPLLSPAACAMDPAALRALVTQIGRELKLDALALSDMPRSWGGFANPLAEGGLPSPSFGWKLGLEATEEATLTRILGKDARKKLRQKERWLAQIGEVSYDRPCGPTETARALDAFFAQKSARFGEMGIIDPFAGDASREFLRRAALPAAPGSNPALELHILSIGERIAAVFGGAADAQRMSGMFISFDNSPEIARCSPGDLLVAKIIGRQCTEGRKVFDLGVGEAPYKRKFCKEPEELADVVIPVTARGRLYRAALNAATQLKRGVKQNPAAMRLLAQVRRMRGRTQAVETSLKAAE